MFDRAGLKLGLDKAVLQSMNTDQGKNKAEKANQMSKKEVEDLLKKGAYGALMDDDNAGDKFCEEDIDSILERRATTVTAESTLISRIFFIIFNRPDFTCCPKGTNHPLNVFNIKLFCSSSEFNETS